MFFQTKQEIHLSIIYEMDYHLNVTDRSTPVFPDHNKHTRFNIGERCPDGNPSADGFLLTISLIPHGIPREFRPDISFSGACGRLSPPAACDHVRAFIRKRAGALWGVPARNHSESAGQFLTEFRSSRGQPFRDRFCPADQHGRRPHRRGSPCC